ncbi:response regulator transcription factor [Klebsiella aerogenes]|uniref:helix-turn-helix transcriptional regulator n=1 Tax=Klebsiella aerogenes TaxID=548 RepID=UPI00294A067B|nr:response regulator transcription factor [Klebsiella aerogenes]EME8857319.1 response regulator transcription factor [Klebsiella aerogenes]
MATDDPMDLDVRSQAFLRDFYQFHKNSCDAWYIKDANHRFMDASITFLSRFSPPDLTSVIGLGDDVVSEASSRDIALMYEFESLVMSQGKNVVILTWNYLTDHYDVKSFVLKMKPWHYSNGVGVIVCVSDLAAVNKKIDWLSCLVSGSLTIEQSSVSTSSTFSNPLSYVTESEWEVAWLIICSCSIRWIASNFDVSVKTVEIKARNAYMKLNAFDREGLIRMAEKYGWINIIPARFVSASNLIRIC